MADIEKITISGQDYDIVDAGARQSLGNKQPKLTSANAGTNVTITEESGVVKINSTGGSGGTTDYTALTNKPQIGGTTLTGNKTLAELGIQPTLTSANAGTNVTITTTGGTLKINSTATGGTTDYEDLDNKPSINSTELSGELTSEDLGLQSALTSGDGILIEEDNTISVKTDGVTVGFNAEGELISEVKESIYRGEFANWASVPTDEDEYLPDHNQLTELSANDYIIVDDASDYENNEYTIKFSKVGSNGVKLFIDGQLESTVYGQGTAFGRGPYGDLNIYYYYDTPTRTNTIEIVGLRDFYATRAGDEPIRVKTKGLLQIEWDSTIDSYEYTIQPALGVTDGKWKFIRLSNSGDIKNAWVPAYRLDKDSVLNFTSGNHVIAEYDEEMDSYKLESKSLLATIDRDTMYDPAVDNEIKVYTDKDKIIIWEDVDIDGTKNYEKAMVPGRFYQNHISQETTEIIEVVRVENFYNNFAIDETAFKAWVASQYHSGVGQFRVVYWRSDSEIIQGIELYDYVTDSIVMYSRTSIEHIESQLAGYGITAQIIDTTKPCAFNVYFTPGYHPIITCTANISKSECSVEDVGTFTAAMLRNDYEKIAFKLSVSSNGSHVKVVYTNKWGQESEDPTDYTADEANDYFYENFGIYLPFWDDDPYAKTGDYVSYLLSSDSLMNDWTEVPNPYDEASKVVTENDTKMSFWIGSQEEYDAISTKSESTLYIIK